MNFNTILLSITLILAQATFAQTKQITLEDIWKNGTFRQENVYGFNSMNDGMHYSALEKDEDGTYISKFAFKNQKLVNYVIQGIDLIPEGKKENIEIESYQFSPDEKKLLIATDIQSIYRHSTKEINYVVDIETKKTTLLSDGKQRYATFSPNGDKVAFVRDNNIFIKNLSNNSETQVTNDGKYNEIINGATDWVYEEEFAFDKAFFWSPDGKKLAYYKFDESEVKEFSMDIYGELYPSQYVFKYPKAGEKNSKVTIHLYHLETKKTNDLALGDYEYIPRIKWTKDPNKLSIQRMNRHQNKLDLILVNATTLEQNVILSETSKTYIDITDNLTFLKNGTQFIWTSEKDGYNHIYLYNLDGSLVTQITKGDWDVSSYEGYNEKTKKIYYLSSEVSPLERHLYSIALDGTQKTKLTKKAGNNRVEFSTGHKYFINYHSNANKPLYISLHDNQGKELMVIKDNGKLQADLIDYDLNPKTFFKFKTSKDVELNGYMIKPANFDSTKKYPVLMYVYGGPGSQTVENKWDNKNYLWYQMLAQKGYIVVSVDNRGTGARGAEFKKMTYKQLGKYEVIDQIESAKYLASLPYVDKNRIGIWGWSYGGYMSSNCIMQGNDVFKMAIAVAPVTTWRYYDSIYTERYMQTPAENANGYDDNSPINHVDKLKGNYLLIHGMADDNVHFQNAVDLSSALINANKQFDEMYYPNKNHGIYGGNTRLHLYTLMTNYILENL